MAEIALVLAAGAAAGFVNGLLGTGGGIVLVFALGRLWRQKDNGEKGEVFALTLAVTAVLSLVSLVGYERSGGLDAAEGLKYGLAAVPGGIAGAYLLNRLDNETMKTVFAFVTVFAGMRMAGVI